MSPLVAAVCAGIAVRLIAGGAPAPFRRPRINAHAPFLGAAAGAVTLLLVLSGSALILGLILLASVTDLVRRWRVRRGRVAAEGTRRLLLAACDGMVADLRAGTAPGPALDAAAEVWPLLRPVSTAVGLGADAAPRIRQLATVPGAEQAVRIAAAWQLAERAGSGLADALDLAVDTLRDELEVAAMIGTEIASARATATLLAVLPFGVLALGQGIGGDVWSFLLTGPGGLACLAGGLCLTHGGMAWLDVIADGSQR